MSKLYRHPVQVHTDPGGWPMSFIWKGIPYTVTYCTATKHMEYYLKRYREPDRYRCETKQGLVCELLRKGEEWQLERVWD